MPRGEQAAMLLLSLLVILSLGLRAAVQMMPARDTEGLAIFEQEALLVLAALSKADSLEKASRSRVYNRESFSRSEAVNHGVKSTFRRTSPITVNSADSAALLPLPGIGPVFAGRIVKYRRLLGGYYKIEQLAEVYGMKQETIEMIKPLLVFDTTTLSKIQLNRADFRELLRHPYLEYEDVKSLLTYLDAEGSIASLSEIRDHDLLTDSTLERMLPYLDFSREF